MNELGAPLLSTPRRSRLARARYPSRRHEYSAAPVTRPPRARSARPGARRLAVELRQPPRPAGRLQAAAPSAAASRGRGDARGAVMPAARRCAPHYVALSRGPKPLSRIAERWAPGLAPCAGQAAMRGMRTAQGRAGSPGLLIDPPLAPDQSWSGPRLRRAWAAFFRGKLGWTETPGCRATWAFEAPHPPQPTPPSRPGVKHDPGAPLAEERAPRPLLPRRGVHCCHDPRRIVTNLFT